MTYRMINDGDCEDGMIVTQLHIMIHHIERQYHMSSVSDHYAINTNDHYA